MVDFSAELGFLSSPNRSRMGSPPEPAEVSLQPVPQGPSVLLIEPFYGGSHKQLMDFLLHDLGDGASLFATSDKKWHWRARTAALYFSQTIPEIHFYRTLFAGATLNLAELIALRPDLASCRKILYFHENQLIYPAQEEKDRDFQYGYNQILSALTADVNVFNSQFNMDSFLSNIDKFLSKIPSARPKRSVAADIRPKCRVLYFPLNLPVYSHDAWPSEIPTPDRLCDLCCLDRDLSLTENAEDEASVGRRSDGKSDRQVPLHIVWPHRWEHDKNPDFFVTALEVLRAEKVPFRVSVVGQQFSEVPDSFQHMAYSFGDNIKRFGFLPSREAYFSVLKEADVVVSTADHEFFGAAMLEAVHFGCYPLAPHKLVYPELYPDHFLYDASKVSNLVDILRVFCLNPNLVRSKRPHLDVSRFSWTSLREKYLFR